MAKKWTKLEVFYKGLILSTVYTVILVLISLILLVKDTSYIYGSIIGITALWISYLFIWILFFGVDKIKLSMVKALPYLVPIIRLVIFLIFYLVPLLVVNANFWKYPQGMDQILYPINTFMILIGYSIHVISYFTAVLIDIIIESKENKKNLVK